MTEKLKMTNTRKALDWFDRTQWARDLLGDNVRTKHDVQVWQQGQRDAEDKVRRAFFEDTKDRNCFDNCMLVGLSWLRELVAKEDAEKGDA